MTDRAEGEPGARPPAARRFLTLDEVAEELAISWAQAYALVRAGDLGAIKIGGRGQWRVERAALEEFIARAYQHTRAFLRAHPLGAGKDVPGNGGNRDAPAAG